MSTGQTSANRAASSRSAAASAETSTAMKRLLYMRAAPRGDRLLDEVGDVLNALGDRDPGRLQARDLLARRVLPALDDRAGVAERHARHLVHEAPRHERDDRQPRPVVGELRLHPA